MPNTETLLQMQASYDELQSRRHDKEFAVRAYVPSFLDIAATQIEAWADKYLARSELPAFLRRLVLTTGTNLMKVDFPAHDNAQRHRWDGQVETNWQRLGFPPAFQDGSSAATMIHGKRPRRIMPHASVVFPLPNRKASPSYL